MDIDVDNDLLGILAAGDSIDKRAWPALRGDILARLDKIAKNHFPIPNLPPPPSRLHLSDHRPASPPLSPSPDRPLPEPTSSHDHETPPAAASPSAAEPLPLPRQIDDMLTAIKRKIESFDPYPPHTIQRLAELVLRPGAHYKALASYLHAVDRTVQVTSGTNTYPLPPPIPDMAAMRLNGGEAADPAAHISWTNPTTTAAQAAVGSDEALGGALLTPIPWLTRRSSPEPLSSSSAAAAQAAQAAAQAAAQIHSEGTETIDGPNGMGSVETVSVSVNGVPSMGHARGVTQGELLRQEQRAGVVPVSQLSRAHHVAAATESARRFYVAGESSGGGGGGGGGGAGRMDEDEDEEMPHARGPEEIGVGDIGPQSASTSLVGEGGVEMQGIDVEAAMGRKHAERESDRDEGQHQGARERTPDAESESTSSKREAEENLEELEPSGKKAREDLTMEDEQEEDEQEEDEQETAEQQLKEAEGKQEDADRMET